MCGRGSLTSMMLMSEPIVLNDAEARVLGVLIEKQFTTPDNYPLTLNTLGAGCSQKSNRDPVQVFTESEVVVALQGLLAKHLAHKVAQSSARVEKWGHGAREALGLERAELSVLAELLLRGNQAPGELRQRASRMCSIGSLGELDEVLARLVARGFVREFPPAPGSRARCWGQLLYQRAAAPAPADVAPSAPAPATTPSPLGTGLPTRARDEGDELELLRRRVSALEASLVALRTQLHSLASRLGEELAEEPTDS